MGIEKLSSFVSHFGFGKKSGIDLQHELGGLMPTPAWKQKRWKSMWYPGDTVNVGIGQGYTLVTPMQLAQATATLANNGAAMRPHLVASIQEPTSGVVRPVAATIMDKIRLQPSNIAIVKQGMMDVTQPGGTASSVGARSPYLIAAKTGTAQVVGMKQNERYNASKLAERHRDHALFIAYAPAEDPKIALSVIVENGGHGGSAAGPIARKVMDYYLLGKTPEPKTPVKGKTSEVNPPAVTMPEHEEALHD